MPLSSSSSGPTSVDLRRRRTRKQPYEIQNVYRVSENDDEPNDQLKISGVDLVGREEEEEEEHDDDDDKQGIIVASHRLQYWLSLMMDTNLAERIGILSQHRRLVFGSPPPPYYSKRQRQQQQTQQDPEFVGLVIVLVRWIRFCIIRVARIAFSASIYYWFLYKWYMPKQVFHSTFPFHYPYYYYGDQDQPPQEHSFADFVKDENYLSYDPVIGFPSILTKEHLHTYETKATMTKTTTSPSPFAIVDLLAEHFDSSPPSWESFASDTKFSADLGTPTKRKKNRLLYPGRFYQIDLELILPDSMANRLQSMFGLRIELWYNGNQSPNREATKQLLARSRQSTRFPHQTPWINHLQKFILLPALLMGFWDESKIISLLPIRRYGESREYPLQSISIHVLTMPKPGESSSSLLEISRGVIRITEEMNRLQELLKGWFYTCLMIGTIVVGWILELLWNVSHYFRQSSRSLPWSVNEEPPCDLDFDEWDDDDDIFANPMNTMHREAFSRMDESPSRYTWEDNDEFVQDSQRKHSHPSNGERKPSPWRNFVNHEVSMEDSSQDSWEDIPEEVEQ